MSLCPHRRKLGSILKTMQSFDLNKHYSQPATDCSLMEGKLSIVLFSPSSISFNDNTIVRNFYPRKFQRFAANFKGIYIVIMQWQIQREDPGGPVPLIRPVDACLRLKFLHRQDHISLFNWLFFFNETRKLHFAT